ncbi:MAG TPA: choice-of-anchor D domain-containing protein, partial [Acidobacteriota bacterium]|nr:choice-of-anchor D domain-containing protein [Acidobacteriota bacterium]
MRRSLPFFLLFTLIIATHSNIFAQSSCPDDSGEPSVSDSSLNFGDVEVGETSSTLSFVLTNSDEFDGMNVTEINSLNSRFQVDHPNLPICLGPFETLTVHVQFVPLSEGLVVSRIHIKTSSGNIDVDTIGTGVGGGGGGVNLRIRPDSINFGQVNVGSKSSESFTITNLGSSSVTIDRINSNNNAFRVTSPSFPRNISGGGSISVNVEFNPSRAANFDANLSIIVGSNTAASVRVFGVGFAGAPDIDLSRLTVSFGAMDAGTFKTENITVSNTGKTDLDVAMP